MRVTQLVLQLTQQVFLNLAFAVIACGVKPALTYNMLIVPTKYIDILVMVMV